MVNLDHIRNLTEEIKTEVRKAIVGQEPHHFAFLRPEPDGVVLDRDFWIDQIPVLASILLSFEIRRFLIGKERLRPQCTGPLHRSDGAEIPHPLKVRLAVGCPRHGPIVCRNRRGGGRGGLAGDRRRHQQRSGDHDRRTTR